LAVQCKAQRCYESQSRQLKNEGEKIFPRFARTDPRCLRQWPYHSKNASYGPAHTIRRTSAGNIHYWRWAWPSIDGVVPTQVVILNYLQDLSTDPLIWSENHSNKGVSGYVYDQHGYIHDQQRA